MIPSDKIKLTITGIAIIILLVSGVFIGRCTKSSVNNDNKYFDMLMAAKDSLNSIHERDRIHDEEDIQILREANDALIEKDSTLTAHFINDQEIYKHLADKLHTIPSLIQRISGNNDSIRNEFSKF